MDVLGVSARELARLVRAGEVSAREVTQAYLDRIEQTEPHIHAYLTRLPERALAEADAVDEGRARGDELGALAGVPIGLKDIFVTKGVTTSCGSRMLADYEPSYDGSHARRLGEAGGVLLGKLAMDEFAMGSSNENTPFPPVHNPWALDHVPGGSSGGSAAAVAVGSCALSLGTDTGGSIRQPASLCGVVGIKPTYGRVSRYGMVAFASSLDQAGPFAREVRDAALMLGVIAGHDPNDATSLRAPVPDYVAACDEGIRGKRIGVHRAALEMDGLDADVRGAFEQSSKILEDAGAVLVDIELPHFEYAIATYYVLATAEASSNLARYDGVRYGLREPRDSLLSMYEATRESGFGDEVKRRIMLGTFVLRADSYEQYYGRAMRVRTLIARDYARAFEQCDLIASPVSPVAGWRLGERVSDPLAMYLADVFTIGVNLAGLPGISVPAGFSSGSVRLPIGLQLIGPRLSEPRLFAAAAAHEAATSWHTERPPEVST